MRTDAARLFAAAALAVFFSIASRSMAAPVDDVLPPDLLQKYQTYREGYIARHIWQGGTVEAELDAETRTKFIKPYGEGDSQGWTGLTMAIFAFQNDWDLVKTNLSYWDLAKDEPGKYIRWPQMPRDYGHGETSIDQYGEMLMGIAAVWMTGPPELKAQVRQITKEMIQYGMERDWIMGKGPWVDCEDIRFLFVLLDEKMGLGLNPLKPGETRDEARKSFINQFGAAFFVRHGSPNYFTLNLFCERMLVAKWLEPDLEGLDDAIAKWHKVVKIDRNALFDWLYARAMKKDVSFVVEELRKFPSYLPNRWNDDGFSCGYRWERSPEQIDKAANGINVESSGMDFLALASFYAYFEKNDF